MKGLMFQSPPVGRYVQCLTQLGEPLEPTPQCGQFGQSGLGPTAPIA